MARFYANENFPLQTVQELRRLGHDVLTSLEAGYANRSVPDEEVLAFAAGEQRVLLTQNRLHFLRLHRRGDYPTRRHCHLHLRPRLRAAGLTHP